MTTEPKWIVTLVHGTWARGFFNLDKPTKTPRWFEDSSRFMTHLLWRFRDAEIAEAKIEVCKWSGANSIIERDQAASQLAKQLIEQQQRWPESRQLVIAHSHGGNVAVRALEHLGGAADKLLVATMATPFLEMFPPEREYVPHEKIQFSFMGYILVLVSSIYLCLEYAEKLFPPVAGTLLAVGAIWVVRQILAVRARRRTIELTDYVDRLARATSHGALYKSKAELLVLRGVDDEAGLSIAAGAVSRRLAIFNAWLIDEAIINRYTVYPSCAFSFLIFGSQFLPHSLAAPIHNWMQSPAFEHYLFLVGSILFKAIAVIFVSYLVSAMCLAVYPKSYQAPKVGSRPWLS
jgi:hypothetical protein